MPDRNQNFPSADEILLAAAALAKHLSDAGVQFAPIADVAQVAELSQNLRPYCDDRPIHATVETDAHETLVDATTRPPETPRVRVVEPQTQPAARLPQPTQGYSLPVLSLDERTERLTDLKNLVAACTRCPLLTQTRINTVFGEGNPTARVAFFGEGPGADEDRSGRPFVGRAGQLLTKMIEACKFAREDVYILNTVKCRPPGNRNPEPNELANCREYFEHQLAVIQPQYIVCLGAVSAQALLQTTQSVGQLRGRWHQYNASKALVTYHPAYLLRNPAAKKAAWDDLKMMLSDMGIQI